MTTVRFAAVFGWAALMLVSAAPSVEAQGAAASTSNLASDWKSIPSDDLLVIDTNKGRIVVELAPLIAPRHVAQVKALAHQHFYDGQTFFRVIDAFMAQTGDPENTGKGGSKLPNIPAEFTLRRDPQTPFAEVAQPAGGAEGFVGVMPVYSQADALMSMTGDGKVAAWPAFCPGVAGMARDSEPDSANSQFFLMRQAYPSLEKRYTAFGRVVSGLDVVRAIKAGEPVEAPQDLMRTVRLATDLPVSERPRLQRLDATSAAFRAAVAAARAGKGADFSICDVELPVRAG